MRPRARHGRSRPSTSGLVDRDQSLTRARSAAELRRRLLGLAHVRRVRDVRPGKEARRLHGRRVGGVPARRGAQARDPWPEPQVGGARAPLRARVPLQGRRDRAAAHPGGDRARRDVRAVPAVRRRAAQPGGPVVADPGTQHRRVRGDAGRRPRRPPGRDRRAERRARARRAAPHAGEPRRGRARLPVARPRVGDAVGRRGAAGEDGPPPRLEPVRRHLCLRRADDRPAPARRRPRQPAAGGAARQGQHRARRRARAARDRDRRPRGRHGPGGRRARRHRRLRGRRRRPARVGHGHRPPLRHRPLAQGDRARALRRPPRRARRAAQPARRHRRRPARRAGRRHRRRRLGQELADPRLPRARTTP